MVIEHYELKDDDYCITLEHEGKRIRILVPDKWLDLWSEDDNILELGLNLVTDHHYY